MQVSSISLNNRRASQNSPSFGNKIAPKSLATFVLGTIVAIGGFTTAHAQKNANNLPSIAEQCKSLRTITTYDDFQVPTEIVRTKKNRGLINNLRNNFDQVREGKDACDKRDIVSLFLPKGNKKASVMHRQEGQINEAYKAFLRYKAALKKMGVKIVLK